MVELVAMADTIGRDARNIPATIPKAGGYDTGEFAWTAQDWGRLPDSGHVHINQDGVDPFLGDVFDVEAGAITEQRMLEIAQERYARRLATDIYVSESRLGAMRAALAPAVLLKSVWFWVAWWGLTHQQAAELIADNGDVVAVQLASPATGGNTILPGTNLTLDEANADLSLARAAWHPAPAPAAPAGVAYARVAFNLATGAWDVQPEPGDVTLGAREAQASSELQFDVSTGRWRVAPLAWNAPPLK